MIMSPFSSFHDPYLTNNLSCTFSYNNKGKAPEVFYWENTEGGHGGAADNKQRAHMWALTYSMLKQTLGLDDSK